MHPQARSVVVPCRTACPRAAGIETRTGKGSRSPGARILAAGSVVLIALVLPPSALARPSNLHEDPFATVALALAVILVAAKIGGDLAARLGQPAVLGELVMGVAMGNLPLLGYSGFEFIKSDPTVDMLARMGVLILLFEVGVEATVGQMLKVGLSSLLVAIMGVVAPFALGWGAGALLLPGSTWHLHAFLGAALCATSVGITARVFQDLGRTQSREARVVLGAAVIDDVLGLVVLAVVSGVIVAADEGRALSLGMIGWVVVKALVFLVGSLALGVYLSPKLFHLASRLQARGVLLATGLAFCFFLAWVSTRFGLASIVGAFAAGLILEDLHYRDFVSRGEHALDEVLRPISSFLVPVFFVLTGMQTDLRSWAQPGTIGVAAALTVLAILGKLACSLGVTGRGLDRLSIGIAMVPRGEVGLIFANIGLTLTFGGVPIIDSATYSAIVIMVIATTLFTPPALKWSLGRSSPPIQA